MSIYFLENRIHELQSDIYLSFLYIGVTLCTSGASLECSVPAAMHSSNSKERCIRPQYLCDGHNDCHNGHFLSDEFGCGKLILLSLNLYVLLFKQASILNILLQHLNDKHSILPSSSIHFQCV